MESFFIWKSLTIPIMMALPLGQPQWARFFGGAEPDLSLALILSTFGIVLFPLVGGLGGLIGARLFGGEPSPARPVTRPERQASRSSHLQGEMVKQLRANPRDASLFEELCDFYLAATPEQREDVRTFVRDDRDLMNVLDA